jgi:hypothetical protein
MILCLGGIPPVERHSYASSNKAHTHCKTEGPGFEPGRPVTRPNGFQDRRIQPLCHPSKQGRRRLDDSLSPIRLLRYSRTGSC